MLLPEGRGGGADAAATRRRALWDYEDCAGKDSGDQGQGWGRVQQ